MSYFDNPLTDKRAREAESPVKEATGHTLETLAPQIAELMHAMQDKLQQDVNEGRGQSDVHDELIGIPRKEFAAGSASLLAASADQRGVDPADLLRLITQYPWLPAVVTDVVTSFFLMGGEHQRRS